MTEPSEQRPRMGPTRPSTLVVAGLSALAVAWLVISRFYGDFRELPWLPIAVSAALAILEGYLALTTRARIERPTFRSIGVIVRCAAYLPISDAGDRRRGIAPRQSAPTPRRPVATIRFAPE